METQNDCKMYVYFVCSKKISSNCISSVKVWKLCFNFLLCAHINKYFIKLHFNLGITEIARKTVESNLSVIWSVGERIL